MTKLLPHVNHTSRTFRSSGDGEKLAEICTLGEGRFGCESVSMQVDQEKAGISGAYDGVDEPERKFSPSLTK